MALLSSDDRWAPDSEMVLIMAEFEARARQRRPELDLRRQLNGDYSNVFTQAVFMGFLLAKE